jgi:hypothetical protein
MPCLLALVAEVLVESVIYSYVSALAQLEPSLQRGTFLERVGESSR